MHVHHHIAAYLSGRENPLIHKGFNVVLTVFQASGMAKTFGG